MKRLNANRINKDKELSILLFLWRWKVATTSAIYTRFQPVYSWAAFTAYQRLLKLKSKGLIEVKLVNSRQYAYWTLTRAGFHAIRDELPLLKEEGFASEAPEHDLYVLAAQSGDWLPKGSVDDVAFFTEQELRRQAPETLFSWLPPTTAHRPDGYWYFPKSKPNALIALEVEVNRKAFSDYIAYGNFYNRYKVIESVLWIVQSENLAHKITNAAHKNLAEFRGIHNFVLLKDFLESGWCARIFEGPARRSEMGAFLNSHRLNQVETKPKPTINRGLVSSILDSRHRRFLSNTCANRKIAPIR
ncbi:MAG: hypothetical protein AB7G93_00960 [Bdellovibrionales bacterium]